MLLYISNRLLEAKEMPDPLDLQMNMKNLWRRTEEPEREIMLLFCLLQPPTSVDTLVSLSHGSAVTALDAIEKLRKVKLACEKKGHRKGIYFPPDDVSLPALVEACVPADELQRVGRKILEYYERFSYFSEEQTVMLADLYGRFGHAGEGSRHLKAAAVLMQRRGQKEKALAYFNRLLLAFQAADPTEATVEDFLDSVIGITTIMMMRMPVDEQIRLLSRAEKCAARYKKNSHLSMIKLYLGRLYQDAGSTAKAARYINGALELMQENQDPSILRSATLLMSEYLTWKGLFSEATHRYEEMVGNVEKFGESEAVLMSSQIIGLAHVFCGRVARGLGMIDAVRTKAQRLELHEAARMCDMMHTICLLELDKIPEAAELLQGLLLVPEDILGPHVLWGVHDCMAYVHCVNQQYEAAFESMAKAYELSRSIGRASCVALWRFQVLDTLEAKGLVSKAFNFDSEWRQVLSSDNIYLKGIGLRYRALRRIERGGPMKEVLADLEESERYLEQSGAQIQLARTRVALAKCYRSQGKVEESELCLGKASSFLSTLDRDLVPRDLLDLIPKEEKVGFMIERLTRINESLGTTRDASSFLDRVLNVAMDFTLAMRGAFLIVEDNNLKTLASRNMDPSSFGFEDWRKISNVLLRALRDGVELLDPETEWGKMVPGDSKASLPRSMICMPARLGDTVYGYLCLDNRLGNKRFSVDELPFLRMLCSQVAVGLADIRLHEELKEQRDRFEDENIYYKREMGIADATAEIVGESEAMKRVLTQVGHVASTGSSVLILGETGVGKELVAKAVHNLGRNAKGPFISVSLATLPPDLVASELFGHEKGAFTGAYQQAKGRFELADGGTIFLDEIGDAPLNVQVKLLRVLQENTFERLGSAKPIKSNFVVIAATNKDLRAEVENKTFREDLYYRLNVFPISIPPLRERNEDIPPLARHFVEKFNRKLGKHVRQIPPHEMRRLIDYAWPGNVRELQHVIERAVILSDGHAVSFPEYDRPHGMKIPEDGQLITLEDVEREHIKKILERTGWREGGPQGAATLLGLKSTTLRFRMKKLGIEKPAFARYNRR
jgi:transcriptional regulator with GAF, ATPase, and Fis domain